MHYFLKSSVITRHYLNNYVCVCIFIFKIMTKLIIEIVFFLLNIVLKKKKKSLRIIFFGCMIKQIKNPFLNFQYN